MQCGSVGITKRPAVLRVVTNTRPFQIARTTKKKSFIFPIKSTVINTKHFVASGRTCAGALTPPTQLQLLISPYFTLFQYNSVKSTDCASSHCEVCSFCCYFVCLVLKYFPQLPVTRHSEFTTFQLNILRNDIPIMKDKGNCFRQAMPLWS